MYDLCYKSDFGNKKGDISMNQKKTIVMNFD